MAYEILALEFTHYQHVIVTLDVDECSYGVATDFNRTKHCQNVFRVYTSDRIDIPYNQDSSVARNPWYTPLFHLDYI